MGSRLGRRVVNFANLPINLLMPSTFTNIKEIAIKTIPSASKIEIKRVLGSLYEFEVENVRTLNMEGKKWKRGWLLMAKPDYKKAYITLKSPLSISPDIYSIRLIEENKASSCKVPLELHEVQSWWVRQRCFELLEGIKTSVKCDQNLYMKVPFYCWDIHNQLRCSRHPIVQFDKMFEVSFYLK